MSSVCHLGPYVVEPSGVLHGASWLWLVLAIRLENHFIVDHVFVSRRRSDKILLTGRLKTMHIQDEENASHRPGENIRKRRI